MFFLRFVDMVSKGELEVLTLWEYVKSVSLIALELGITIDEVYKCRDEFCALSNVKLCISVDDVKSVVFYSGNSCGFLPVVSDVLSSGDVIIEGV